MSLIEEIKKSLYCNNYEIKGKYDMNFITADIFAENHKNRERIFFYNWDKQKSTDLDSFESLCENINNHVKKNLVKFAEKINGVYVVINILFSSKGFNDDLKEYVQTKKSLRSYVYLLDFKNNEIVKLEKLGFVGRIPVSQIINRNSKLLHEIMESCKDISQTNIVVETTEANELHPKISAKKEEVVLEENIKYENLCQNCKKEKPVIKRKFKKQLNLIWFVKESEYKGILCDECAKQIGSDYIGYTAVAGWWGVLFFMNPIIIISNIINMNKKGILKNG